MLATIASLLTITTCVLTIVKIIRPAMRAMVHFEDLYERLIPSRGPCIVDRMETVETKVTAVESSVRHLHNDVETLKKETHEQTEELGKQTESLGRIEEATSPPATTERDAEMVRKLGGDQTQQT